MSTRFDLHGKVAVVTGGSRGLGLAMARAFAEHGADVVIASRKRDACEAVAAELRTRFACRAKAGLHAMAAGMSHAYGGRVRVNVLMPGAFLTDISTAWSAEVRAQMEAGVPMGRCGNAEEIVGAALYLASDASSYTSGAVIKVD